MQDAGREARTEYYPSKAGAFGALAFCLLMAVVPAFLVFDGGEALGWRVLGAFAMLLFGIGVIAMVDELLRPRATLIMTDQGFTYLGYPHIAWSEVERVRTRIGRLRGRGGEERFAEVVLRNPGEFRSRVEALGDVRARRAVDRPLYIVPERLTVPVPAVVEAMGRHCPALLISSGDSIDSVPVQRHSPDQAMVETALTAALTDILPAGWQFAVMWFALIGDDGHAGLQVQSADETVDDLTPSEEILTLLNRYKDICYDRMTGTWLSGTIAVKAGVDKAKFDTSRTEVPDWLPMPDADECRRELNAYPRAGDEIPDWMRARIS
ncbi:hypothetical protein [Nocardia huaxiensis]|uniref:Uncharacterized protein n=1 Tax=Nocardia huaxiensis TaxID=2755382 RepID=A0A7D6VLX6_9NOCA|nr:hypothetical protein [Nocardia huaxiensis]QLY32590.1 hypothetical protein H0264_10310 [Nocardia huaxiensis]UFS93682.1 hypothetical protein LPY97_23065 [Nocardia huaxiensis]